MGEKNIWEPGRGKGGGGRGGNQDTLIQGGSSPGANHLNETAWLFQFFLLPFIEVDKDVMFLLQEKLDGLRLREQQDSKLKSTDE